MYLSAIGVQRVITNRLPVTTLEALAALESFAVCRDHFPKLYQKAREFSIGSIQEAYGANLRGDSQTEDKEAPQSYPRRQQNEGNEMQEERVMNEEEFRRHIVRKCHD